MIMNFYLVNDLTVSPLCGANFGNSRYILGGVIAGIGALAGGLIGGGMTSSSTKSANATNYKIAQEYNANQIRLAEMQNKWNVEQRDYMNNYNSPVEQLKRFRSAGINPYMALSNINSGNQDSALSAVQPQQQAPPSMIAPSYDYIGKSVESGIGAVASLAQAAFANAETKGKHIENVYNNDVLEARVKKYLNETKLTNYDAYVRAHTYLNEVQLSDLNVSMQKQELLNARATEFNIKADTRLKQMSSTLTDKQINQLDYMVNRILPQQLENMRKEGRLLSLKAVTEVVQQNLARSQINLNEQQAKEIEEVLPYKVAGLQAENAAKRLAFDEAFDSYDLNIDTKRAENFRAWSQKTPIGEIPYANRTFYENTRKNLPAGTVHKRSKRYYYDKTFKK